VGASVILRNGALVAYLRRGNPNLEVFLPADEPEYSQAARDLASFLAAIVQKRRSQDHHGGMLISTINGEPAGRHPLKRFLLEAGFRIAPRGFNLRRPPGTPPGETPPHSQTREED
jgi:ATP-dependent Lhr-like helicase